MKTNFQFAQHDWPDIFTVALKAEKLTYLSPRSSCFNSRLASERILHCLYDHDPEQQSPYEENPSSSPFEVIMETLTGRRIHSKITTIHQQGIH